MSGFGGGTGQVAERPSHLASRAHSVVLLQTTEFLALMVQVVPLQQGPSDGLKKAKSLKVIFRRKSTH